MKKGLMVGAMALVLAGSAAAGTLALAAQQEPLAAELTAVEAAVLRQGSTGGEVKEVQRRLKNWGYYTGAVDGIFGAGTKKAVVWFQQKNGLTADGAAYEGYYLTLAGDFDFEAFSYNEGTDGASLCREEGAEEPLAFDAALSAALSGGALPVGEEKAAVHGELCFVFSLTEEQYGCLAGAESGAYIRLLLGDCREEADGETVPVQFRFAADRIAVQGK